MRSGNIGLRPGLLAWFWVNKELIILCFFLWISLRQHSSQIGSELASQPPPVSPGLPWSDWLKVRMVHLWPRDAASERRAATAGERQLVFVWVFFDKSGALKAGPRSERPSRTSPASGGWSDCGGDVGHWVMTAVGVVASYYHTALTFPSRVIAAFKQLCGWQGCISSLL